MKLRMLGSPGYDVETSNPDETWTHLLPAQACPPKKDRQILGHLAAMGDQCCAWTGRGGKGRDYSWPSTQRD